MHSKCITAVRTAANGRNISDDKIKAIEEAIQASMRELARMDRTRWAGLTLDQRVTEAAAAAIRKTESEAARKEFLASQQMLKTDETNNRIKSFMELNKLTRSKALVRDITTTNNYVDSVRNEAISGLTDMIDAVSDTSQVGIGRSLAMRIWSLDNPAMTADVIREIFAKSDGRTGNKDAQKAAQAWLTTIEKLRQRFNATGGNIRQVGYGYLTQIHDAVKVQSVSAVEWATKVLPLLNREYYVRADGRLMSDAEVLTVLESAHATIISNGLNKVEPGAFRGTGSTATHGSDARVIHFKDGDAWITYMQEFGEGSLYDAMLGHVGGMSRDIGLVERYGPNPQMQFRLQNDIAERADGRGTLGNRNIGNTPQAYWDLLTGKASTAENPTVAKAFQDARNLQVAAKLGRAVISSLTDSITIASSLRFNRIPYLQMLQNLGRQFSQEHRDMLTSHGIIAESVASSMDRISGDYLTYSASGRLAASVMKLSLMNAWTDGLRSAFASTMMQNFSKKVGSGWADLDEWDQYLLRRKGIEEADWQIITQANLTESNGARYLTRDSVASVKAEGAQQVATKWLAFVSDESQFAVVNPDLATRAIVTGGGMPTGTISGEAARTAAQFKSFPIAMMTRHWERILETPQGLEGAPLGYGAQTATGATVNRAALLAALSVGTMLMGSIVLQIKSLLAGKDPADMTDPNFWIRALAQGGGLGYLGDWLLKDPTEPTGNNFQQGVGSVLGPVAGMVAGLAGDVVLTNVWSAAKGKETDVGADSLKLINSNLPYASLWQISGIWDHWIIHNMQEMLNPGYLSRMQQRAMRDYGQSYYWEPGEFLPERAPDFEAALGE